MADLRKLKDLAADRFAKGRYAEAVPLLEQVLRIAPGDVESRQKLGDALQRSGDMASAVNTYQEVAERYAARGELVKAIAICKVILELAPSRAVTQQMLQTLSERRGEARPTLELDSNDPLPRYWGAEATLPPIPIGPLEAQPLAADVSRMRAVREGREDTPGIAPRAGAHDARRTEGRFVGRSERVGSSAMELGAVEIEHLPKIPLFAELTREACVSLAQKVTLRRVPAGTVVLREGDDGTSCFVVAAGSVRVEKATGEATKPTVLARLQAGAFFGEMALLSGAQRTASVVTEAPCALLEIDAEVLKNLARSHPHVASSVTQSFRQRLIENALATSPLFRAFERKDQVDIMRRFLTRLRVPGDVVVKEGQPSDGLYLILAGAVDVVKEKEGGQLCVCLAEGDVFGEESCLNRAPALASAVVRKRATLLWLPREAFLEVVVAYPPLLDRIAEICEEREQRVAATQGERGRKGGASRLS